MTMHRSSVNFQNLIRDLAEMYPFEVAEVVLIELVANALDAGATLISVDFDPQRKVLVVTDNGKGMTSTDFDQYHDFAAGLKTRGEGIGFAGVGAKIAFNIADRVVTETCSESFSGGSNWYLQSKKALIWEDIQPTHLKGTGTRVEVIFAPDAVLPFSSSEDLTRLLRRHYLPLLDSDFLDLYERTGFYRSQLSFMVNGEPVMPGRVEAHFGLEHYKEFFPKKAGKRVGYGILGLAPSEYPLGPDVCGVLVCTRGKVIKADLFNQFHVLSPRIFGVVEVPDLVHFLTTAKTDFIRRGKHREFEGLYDPIRQEFKTWLSEVGIQPLEVAGTDEARRLERELRKVLDEVPELGDFFGFRTRKSVLVPSEDGTVVANTQEGTEETFPIGEGEGGQGPGPVDVGEQPGTALVRDEESGTTRATPISRAGRRGPRIGLSEAPDRVDMAWVEGNNVVINSAHPCYLKVRSDAASRRLHSLYAIGTAIQRFLAEAGDKQDLSFIDRMMAAWAKK